MPLMRLRCNAYNFHSSHTPGLCCLQLDLANDGTFFFAGDQFHVEENYTKKIPQGEQSHALIPEQQN